MEKGREGSSLVRLLGDARRLFTGVAAGDSLHRIDEAGVSRRRSSNAGWEGDRSCIRAAVSCEDMVTDGEGELVIDRRPSLDRVRGRQAASARARKPSGLLALWPFFRVLV